MRILTAIALILIASIAEADTRIVFSGLPSVRATDAGIGREAKPLASKEAKQFEVIVTEDGGKYYWASRENKPLMRIENEQFITFVAPGGEGYIKIAKPETVKMLRAGIQEYSFTYIEHMTAGLTTYTYFGSERVSR